MERTSRHRTASSDRPRSFDWSSTNSAQLDRFLQRFDGDLWKRTAASPHSDEILSAKHDHASAEVALVVDRLWEGAATYLAKRVPGRSAAVVARRAGWIDLLRLSPTGFKADQPDVDTYRRRLATLAQTVASDIETR